MPKFLIIPDAVFQRAIKAKDIVGHAVHNIFDSRDFFFVDGADRDHETEFYNNKSVAITQFQGTFHNEFTSKNKSHQVHETVS